MGPLTQEKLGGQPMFSMSGTQKIPMQPLQKNLAPTSERYDTNIINKTACLRIFFSD